MGQEIASLFVTVGANLSNLTSGLNSVKSQLTSLGQQMQSAGTAATMGLTVPLVGVGVAAAKVATDLNTQMQNIQSIARLPQENLDALRRTFVSMSTDLGVTRDSALKLAEGFYQIQSSGFAGEDAMTVLRESTKAATAGLTDTETAVRAVTTVLNAYSLNANDAAHVSDVMFRAVDVGIFSFGQLANAIGDTLGSASAAKVPIETVAAALATMTKAGINVNEATTSMNQMILSIIDPASGAADAASALGLQFDAAHLAAVGLPKVLSEISAATGGNIEKLSELFPNVRALRGVLSLLRGEGVSFAGDLQKIADASGATSKAFEIQTQSWSAQFDNLKNRGTASLISIGEVLVPAALSIVKAIQPIVDGMKQMNPEWVKWAIVIGGVLAAIGPVLSVLGTLTVVLGALLSPVGLLVAAIGALGVAVATNFGGLRDLLTGIVSTLAPAISELTVRFRGLWEALTTNNPSAFFANLTALFSTLRDKVVPALQQVGAAVLTWLVQMGTQLVQNLQPWAAALVDWIGPQTQVLISRLIEFAMAGWTWITSQGPVWFEKARQWGVSLVEWVKPQIPVLLERLGELANGVASWIGTQVISLDTNLLRWATAFIEWISPSTQPMLGKLGELQGTMLGWIIGTALPAITNKLLEWGKAYHEWIEKEAIPKLKPELDKFLKVLGNWVITEVLPGLVEHGRRASAAFISGIANGLQTSWASLRATAQGLVSDYVMWFTSPLQNAIIQAANFIRNGWSQIRSAGEFAFRGVIDGISSAMMQITSPLQNGIINAVNTLRNLWSQFNQAGRFLIQGLIDGIQSMVEQAIRSVGRIGSDIMQVIRQMFGIRSPSTVFAGYGQMMMAGLAQGITDSARMPQLALNGMQLSPTFAGVGAGPALTQPVGDPNAGGRQIFIDQVIIQNGMDMAQFKALLKEA